MSYSRVLGLSAAFFLLATPPLLDQHDRDATSVLSARRASLLSLPGSRPVSNDHKNQASELTIGYVGEQNGTCGCYFRPSRSSQRYVFYSPLRLPGRTGDNRDSTQEAIINVDGADVKMRGTSSTEPNGTLRLGQKLTRTYTAGGLTVRAVYIITRVCAPHQQDCQSADFRATFTVTKGARSKVVHAVGGCGC